MFDNVVLLLDILPVNVTECVFGNSFNHIIGIAVIKLLCS